MVPWELERQVSAQSALVPWVLALSAVQAQAFRFPLGLCLALTAERLCPVPGARQQWSQAQWTRLPLQCFLQVWNQIYIYATNEITFDSGNTISLKKTTLNASSVAACIQNNPLYTLQGAVYEIHQGSANGTVVETLTTNANGEAAGTKKYPLGTKLYAVEKTAPSGCRR